jgi:hypothetical protein
MTPSAEPLQRLDVTAEHYLLGAMHLELISDWDAWVYRRVDSFAFAGDDERVLERQQSIDFRVPAELAELPQTLVEAFSGFPVPITFMNKWRLPRFSLRDERGSALPLLPRHQSVPIAVGMLVALGNFVVRRSLAPLADLAMPAEVQEKIASIVAAEPADALRLCAVFCENPEMLLAAGEPWTESEQWQVRLASDDVFMSLLYELARGFLLTAVCALPATKRRVIKFSYHSYVVPPQRDRKLVRARHVLRTLRSRSRDWADSVAWGRRTEGDAGYGRVVFSTVGEFAARAPRQPGPSVASALATIVGPGRRRRTMRLRPNSAVAIDHLPPASYKIRLRGRSGFHVAGDTHRRIVIRGKETAHVRVTTRQSEIGAKTTLAAPLIARPASSIRTMSRGFAWHSKPLIIRVRVGDGGSYHCEFEAPDGLHVTRARLVSDVDIDSGERSRELDLVLSSTQRAHLYAPAHRAKPAAAYAYLNIRPRVETIARPAFVTSCIATAALVFLAFFWDSREGFALHGPEDSSALLVVLLGAPSGLAAYFAQAVPSRVTNSMLYGLRLSALLPAILALTAGAVVLVGIGTPDSHVALRILVGGALLTNAALFATQRLAEHPPEQRRVDLRQGKGFEKRYSLPDAEGPDDGAAKPVVSSRP